MFLDFYLFFFFSFVFLFFLLEIKLMNSHLPGRHCVLLSYILSLSLLDCTSLPLFNISYSFFSPWVLFLLYFNKDKIVPYLYLYLKKKKKLHPVIPSKHHYLLGFSGATTPKMNDSTCCLPFLLVKSLFADLRLWLPLTLYTLVSGFPVGLLKASLSLFSYFLTLSSHGSLLIVWAVLPLTPFSFFAGPLSFSLLHLFPYSVAQLQSMLRV